MSDPLANLVTRTEPRQRQGAIARALDPVRIGFLVDFWMPDAYLRKLYAEPILLAFEEAVAAGRVNRPLELVVERAFALSDADTLTLVDLPASLRRVEGRGAFAPATHRPAGNPRSAAKARRDTRANRRADSFSDSQLRGFRCQGAQPERLRTFAGAPTRR